MDFKEDSEMISSMSQGNNSGQRLGGGRSSQTTGRGIIRQVVVVTIHAGIAESLNRGRDSEKKIEIIQKLSHDGNVSVKKAFRVLYEGKWHKCKLLQSLGKQLNNICNKNLKCSCTFTDF